MDKTLTLGCCRIVSTAALTTLVLLPIEQPSAQAQADDAARLGAVEEIVVTARRRAESLQSIPVSVSAFSAEELQRRQISDLEGVADYTAGLNFDDFSTTFNGVVTIRGLTQANIQNRVQNVATFLDGVYIPRNYAVDMGLGNFERIEVVKGPQSALYGQNAFAGALNYVSQKPSTTELLGEVLGTAGTDGRRDYAAGISVPLVDDVLGVRAYFGHTEFDGNRENNFPGDVGDYREVGGYDRDVFSVGALFTPNEHLQIDFLYQRSEREEEVRPNWVVSGTNAAVELDCGPTIPATGGPSFICGQLPDSPDPFQTAVSTRPSGVVMRQQPGSDIEADIGRLGISYQFTDAWALSYVLGAFRAEAQEVAELGDNATAPFLVIQKEGGENEFDSHEVRLSYQPPGGAWSGELGYYHAETDDDFIFGLGFFAGPGPVVDPSNGPLDFTGFAIPFTSNRQEDEVDALFFATTLSLMEERARLGLEGRYSKEKRKLTDNFAPAGSPVQSDDFTDFSPRVTFDFDLSENSLLYASAAKGIKAGGFNGFVSGPVALLPAEQRFDEEENWTYEIGSKNTLMDGRLQLNVALYHIDWSNMQVTTVPSNFDPTIIDPGSVAPTIFLNVGDASSWGVEIEGLAALTDTLRLNYALSYGNPEFDNGTKWGQFVGVCDDLFCPADGDVSGNPLPRQSDTQVALGLEYETVLGNGLEFFARADYTYQSEQAIEAMNFAQIPDRSLLNGSLGFGRDRWNVSLWARNLLDDTYVTNSFFIIQFRRYVPALNDGRTAGITASYRF